MNAKELERGMLTSKKFIFSMCSELTWKALMFYSIHKGVDADSLQWMIAAAGMVQGIFLGGQSFIDAVVRKQAVIMGGKGPGVQE